MKNCGIQKRSTSCGRWFVEGWSAWTAGSSSGFVLNIRNGDWSYHWLPWRICWMYSSLAVERTASWFEIVCSAWFVWCFDWLSWSLWIEPLSEQWNMLRTLWWLHMRLPLECIQGSHLCRRLVFLRLNSKILIVITKCAFRFPQKLESIYVQVRPSNTTFWVVGVQRLPKIFVSVLPQQIQKAFYLVSHRTYRANIWQSWFRIQEVCV